AATDAFAAVCPTVARSTRLRADACFGLSAAAMRAQGFGFSHNESNTQLLLGLDTKARGFLTVAEPIFVSAGAWILVPLVRHNFLYANGASGTSIYQPPLLAFTSEIGVGARIF